MDGSLWAVEGGNKYVIGHKLSRDQNTGLWLVDINQDGHTLRLKAGRRQDVPRRRDGDHQDRPRLLREDGARGLTRHGDWPVIW